MPTPAPQQVAKVLEHERLDSKLFRSRVTQASIEALAARWALMVASLDQAMSDFTGSAVG